MSNDQCTYLHVYIVKYTFHNITFNNVKCEDFLVAVLQSLTMTMDKININICIVYIYLVSSVCTMLSTRCINTHSLYNIVFGRGYTDIPED